MSVFAGHLEFDFAFLLKFDIGLSIEPLLCRLNSLHQTGSKQAALFVKWGELSVILFFCCFLFLKI